MNIESWLKRSPSDYSTMYVDMDAFFASVEQQFRAELRHRPVGVCPCLGDGCSIIASSYEAKRYGIGVGMRLSEARRRCPDIILVHDRPHLYRAISQQIMCILDDTYCKILPKSIDEACLIIPSYARNAESITALYKGIKSTITKYCGEYIKCSIGVGPNMWLAKMIASANKPNGFAIVNTMQLEEFYNGLRLTQLTGINHRLTRRLYRRGIYSVIDLYNASARQLTSWFGLSGEKWYLRLRGYEVDIDYQPKPIQSIGHQTTVLAKSKLNLTDLNSIAVKLATKVGYRLRQHKLVATGIGLWLMGDNRSEFWQDRIRHLPYFCDDGRIVELVQLLLGKRSHHCQVRRLGLYVFGLCNSSQLALFNDSDIDQHNLIIAMDRLKANYHKGIIGRASWLGHDWAPDRIGFGGHEL